MGVTLTSRIPFVTGNLTTANHIRPSKRLDMSLFDPSESVQCNCDVSLWRVLIYRDGVSDNGLSGQQITDQIGVKLEQK